MRLGIKTIIDYSNYGNRFQNYAVQKILSKYGDCVNVDAKYPGASVKRKYQVWSLLSGLLDLFMPGRSFRYFKGIRFNKRLKYASADTCDAFFYGSDQIWNPTYERPDFIIPAIPEKKNIALSASIGIDHIPEEHSEMFAKGLPMFDAISVRENTAVDIVRSYTGKIPELLMDPTLYLSADEWRVIESKKVRRLPKKYVLVFFLGSISDARRKSINAFAKENNAEVVVVFEDKWNNLSPEDMIHLIDHAFIILTDSFHGTVFSIIFSKPFLTYSREDNLLKMNSRLDALLKMFGFESRYNAVLNNDILNCDFSKVPQIIDAERKHMDTFIEDSIASLR